VTAGVKCGAASAIYLAIVLLSSCSHPQLPTVNPWNPKAAAAYLDERELTWINWPVAARDHDTFCVSCHTVLPYVLARPSLRSTLAENKLSDDEQKTLANVRKRVLLWDKVGPYYSDEGYGNGKPTQSRGTEAVLNALILASNDAPSGHLNDITRMALNDMWALQVSAGAGQGSWSWLQFNMEPWEAGDSEYYGAALAAIATGIAPEDYRSSVDIQEKIGLLRDYLTRASARQSMLNRVVLLWASTKLPGLLNPQQQKSIIKEVLSAQEADGGWELSPHAWPRGWNWRSFRQVNFRTDWTRQNTDSDGYATGLITFVLQEAGLPPGNASVRRGLTWLARNQNKEDGSWPSLSLTQRRSPSSNVGHFMRDAATAYAVMALTESVSTPRPGPIASRRPR
jgi:squalene-hopene/tetraprenyl-beta-curcumene cyclase